MIICKLADGWSLKTISSVFGLWQQTWRGILREEKKKISKTNNRTKSSLPYHICQEHFDGAKEYIQLIQIRKIALSTLQDNLNNQTGLGKISKKGTHYLLTKILKYSNELIFSLNKMTMDERKRNVLNSVYLQ